MQITDKIMFNSVLTDFKWTSECPPTIFKDPDVSKLFSCCKEFQEKFSEIPNKSQIRILAESNDLNLPMGFLDALLDFDISEYSESWIKESVENTILWGQFSKKLVGAIELVKSNSEMDPSKVPGLIEKVKSLLSSQSTEIFNENLGNNFWDLETHFVPKSDFITSNHRWLDSISGGYLTKTLNVYCGYANVGKSIFLCNDAANYMNVGIDSIYITLEMSEAMVFQRIGANVFDFPIEYYRNPERKAFIQQRVEDFQISRLFPLGELHVKQFPTGSLTVPQLEAYLNSFASNKGFLPKVLIIDYLNLMSNYRNPNSENTYLKIKQIAEDLRALAIKFNLVVITATQLNRSGSDVSDFTLSSISESQGLTNTSDTMLGIIQTSEMQIVNEYDLKILRTRNSGGKNFRCTYEIDYSRMRLSETDRLQTLE